MKPLRDKTNHSRNRDDSLSFVSRNPIVRDRTISSRGPAMREHRRILLDGYPVVVTRDGERLFAKDGRSVALADAVHLPPDGAVQDHLRAPQLQEPGGRVHGDAAGDADLLPEARERALRAPRPGGAARALPLAQLRGRDRHRHRPALPQHRPRGGGRVHRRLHHRERLWPARLPRHPTRAPCCG